MKIGVTVARTIGTAERLTTAAGVGSVGVPIAVYFVSLAPSACFPNWLTVNRRSSIKPGNLRAVLACGVMTAGLFVVP